MGQDRSSLKGAVPGSRRHSCQRLGKLVEGRQRKGFPRQGRAWSDPVHRSEAVSRLGLERSLPAQERAAYLNQKPMQRLKRPENGTESTQGSCPVSSPSTMLEVLPNYK